MKTLTFAIAVAIAILAVPPAAQAQTATYPTQYLQVPIAYEAKVFSAVDSVALFNTRVIVTGVVQGEPAVSSWAVNLSSSAGDPIEWAAACERKALLAMSKRGQFLLEIQQFTGSYTICKLTRVTP